jgi:Zn-dependent M16 (insulinase) family peptidase
MGDPYNGFGKIITVPFANDQFVYLEGYLRHSYMITEEKFYYYLFDKIFENHKLQFEKLN